ncbi:hypothetical protein L9F63_020903 [Diploptera punctata]|uniref:N-acetyltransferase domain-containing protein n=1 Tax=Diploptera punctata TaxID=6984 RepID=A0AAD7ZRZ3_DIPPU|nr:hypothetical protein L9F63_020903 [Diploptera punctata]
MITIKCHSCNEPISPDDVEGYNLKYAKCHKCTKCIAVLNADGIWCSPEQILKDSPERNGWIQVNTQHDRIVLYVLSQVMYRQLERQEQDVVFDEPDPQDQAAILWQHGEAIGFYTFKPKGLVFNTMVESYQMTTVDSVFIRTAHRRHGHATSMLTHITSCFPQQDIAFSSPISDNMCKVVRKYLNKNPGLREKLWQVEGTGREGDRKLLWYCTRRKKK